MQSMIERVKLENWKSHHETELEFSNGVNALIGTMGSGKSSVLEAIVFGLYGTTPALNSHEVKLDDLIRRSPSKASEAVVKVDFSLEDSYSVERKIVRGEGTKRSELRKNGELIEAPSTQEVTEQVEKILGMDFKQFTRAIYSEQNNLDLFLEMRPGDRKQKIDELLQLDRFEDARQTIVSVENRLKDELDQKQQQVAELQDEIDREEMEELGDEIEEIREKIEELDQKIQENTEEKQELEQKIEELEQKKEKSEKLQQKMTKLETRQESLEERIDEKESDVETPGKKLEAAKEKLREIEERIEELKEMQRELELNTEKLEEAVEEIEELEEQAEKFDEIGELEENIEELESEVEEIKQKGNRLYAERQELEESLEKIDEADECPTCGRNLDKDHREKIVGKRKDRAKEIKETEKNLREKLEGKKDRLENLEEKRDELLQYRNSSERLEQKLEQKQDLEEEIEELEDSIEQIEEEEPEEKREKVEKRIEKLEEAVEAEELREKIEEIEQKMTETGEKLEELEFDKEELEKKQEKLSGLSEKLSVAEKERDSSKELLEEKLKRLETLEEQVERLENLEKETENLDRLLDFVHDYSNGLEETQVALRERFVERLNQLMDSIWSQVYPYDDYYSIRLNAEEGYLLEVLDSENNWISAEAEVSGGERHSAALVMRLGLTFVLSPELELLMLDEPTHNLDSSAVEELADTLHERTSELLDQLFVVTHDPALEASATGKLYQFQKKGTETGLTEVEEVR